MRRILKAFGWSRSESGRWYRSERAGIHHFEVSYRVGKFGPHLGVHLTRDDDYYERHVLYVGFLLGQAWIGFGRSKHGPERRWGFELDRRWVRGYWGCEDRYGNWEGGKHFCWAHWESIKDWVFGRQICLCDRGRTWDVKRGVVSMPEGDYPAEFAFETRIWLRPRSPFRRIRKSTDVDIAMGIPFSGKGENSWDCGEDAIYGTGAEGHDVAKAALSVRETVLRRRAKEGDPECWPMSPEDRALEIAKAREARQKS